MVVGSDIGEEFDCVSGTPVFSADGKRIAYSARKGSKWFIVVGKHKSDAYDAVSEPTFAGKGKWVIFAALRARTLMRVRMDIP